MGVGVPLTYLALLLSQGSDAASRSHIWVASISVLIFGGLLLASLPGLHARHGDWARPVTLGWLASSNPPKIGTEMDRPRCATRWPRRCLAKAAAPDSKRRAHAHHPQDILPYHT